MGNAPPQHAHQTLTVDPLTHLSADLPKLILEERVGNGRFVKTYKCRSGDGVNLIVKLYVNRVKQSPSSANSTNATNAATNAPVMIENNLSDQEDKLTKLYGALSGCDMSYLKNPSINYLFESHPNCLPYQLYFASTKITPDTSKASKANAGGPYYFQPVYLIRQNFLTSLSDRLVTRPFLTDAEKAWIMYQILRAMKGCHENGICHGDFKAENVMVTSWNWVVITDFASFKPVKIPDNDPTSFNFYFHTPSSLAGSALSSIKKCYLAPERFYDPSKARPDDKQILEAELTPAMDIFSVGCTITELYLNGEPTVDLAGLMAYIQQGGEDKSTSSGGGNSSASSNANSSNSKQSKFDSPQKSSEKNDSTDNNKLDLLKKLNKIEDASVRAACRHMLSLDPKKRRSAGDYLKRLEQPGEPTKVEAKVPVQSAADATSAVRKGSSDSTNSSPTTTLPSGAPTVKKSATPPPVLPKSFNNFLFPLMMKLRFKIFSPDARIALIAECYGKAVRELTDGELSDPIGESFFRDVCTYHRTNSEADAHAHADADADADAGIGATNESKRKSELSELLAQTKLILKGLKEGQYDDEMEKELENDCKQLATDYSKNNGSNNGSYNGNDFHNNYNVRNDDNNVGSDSNDGNKSNVGILPPLSSPSDKTYPQFTFISTILMTNVRHCTRPTSKMITLQLISRISKLLPNPLLLQRLVPYICSMLDDPIPAVRALGIKALVNVLSNVESVGVGDFHVFGRYIFKTIRESIGGEIAGERNPNDSEDSGEGDHWLVRIAFAEVLGHLGLVSKRFLDVSQATKMYKAFESNSEPKIENDYEVELAKLHDTISTWFLQLAMGLPTSSADASNSSISSLPKRSLLGNLPPLCAFFGPKMVQQRILPILLTFLNDDSCPALRRDFCRYIPSGICGFIGRRETELFVIPCLENALVDVDDEVVGRAVFALRELIEMGLVSKTKLCGSSGKGLLGKYSPLLLHPSMWVRHEAVKLISCGYSLLQFPDNKVFLLPLIRPFLRYIVDDGKLGDSEVLEGCLRDSVSFKGYRRELERLSELRRAERFREDAGSEAGSGDINDTSGIYTTQAGATIYESGTSVVSKESVEQETKMLGDILDAVGVDVEKMEIGSFSPTKQPQPQLQPLPEIKSVSDEPPLIEEEEEEGSDTVAGAEVDNPDADGDADTDNRDHSHSEDEDSYRFSYNFADEEDLDESKRLKSMSSYLELASRHMMTKMATWHHEKIMDSKRNVNDNNNAVVTNENLNQALHAESLSFPKQAAFPLAVPNQKYSELVVEGVRTAFPNDHQHQDIQSVLNAYGLLRMRDTGAGRKAWKIENSRTSSADVLGDDNYSEEDHSNCAKQDDLIIGRNWGATVSGDPTKVELYKLLGRLKALNIPPLGPRFGTLRGSDGTPYSLHGDYKDNEEVNTQHSSTAPNLTVNNPNAIQNANVTTNVQGAHHFGTLTRDWCPKVDYLVAQSAPNGGVEGSSSSEQFSTSSPHSAAITKLAVSPDNAFFATASLDGTCKVWEMKGLEDTVDNLRPAITYNHRHDDIDVVVNDMCQVENSHSIVSGGSDGSVHIWRVGLVEGQGIGVPGGGIGGGGIGGGGGGGGSESSGNTVSSFNAPHGYGNVGRRLVRGSTVIKQYDLGEGPVLSLGHFNTNMSSNLLAATQCGVTHCLDLRSAEEPFQFVGTRPELGYLKSMAVSSDRYWVCCGSSLGYMSILDLRFMGREVAIWKIPRSHHASHHTQIDVGVHRLATCYTRLATDDVYKPYVVAAASGSGFADSSVYNIEQGTVSRCFRRVSYREWSAGGNKRWMEAPKDLERVDPNNIVFDSQSYFKYDSRPAKRSPHTVRAIMGRISDSGRSFLITGGTDRSINFWDFRDASRCYNVSCMNKNNNNSNMDRGEETVRSYGEGGKMFVSVECEKSGGRGGGEFIRSHKNNFSTNNVVKRADNSHRGVVTDLKSFERPIRGFISVGGDGVVKVWR